MKRRNLLLTVLFSVAILFPTDMGATKFIELKIIDKDYLMLHFRDGEVRYRDDGTGPSAYLGHSFAEGDDTLIVFGRRLDQKLPALPPVGPSVHRTTGHTANSSPLPPIGSPNP